jgi:hypothetical protein
MPGCSILPSISPFRWPGAEIPLPVQIEETDKNFTISWTETYRIDSPAFVYIEKDSRRVRTILGYPIRRILEQTRS